MGSASQQLPGKENNLFKSIVKHYETKQYKKGIKAADAILKKFPEHGETLAMKGLTLNCQERKEEAYEYVRRGLKHDLSSHVCWHVYGLLYRSDRNYWEAIKCYRNALRQDKENIQILRDLSLLQVQMRDLAGFVETRHQLLTLKPSARNNWIAFAVAQHLAGCLDLAVSVVDAYESTQDKEVPVSEKYEHSEVAMYRAKLLQEQGKYEEALVVLEKTGSEVVDLVGLHELKANILLAKGDARGAAKDTFMHLIEMNPDNYKSHYGLHAALGLTAAPGQELSPAQRASLQTLYEKLALDYPRSSAAKRLPLEFLIGDAFKTAAEKYVVPFLRKGIPSLFSDLMSLCTNPEKVKVLEEMFVKSAESLKTSGKLSFTTVDAATVEDPSVLVWVLYYLAQLYDNLGDTTLALQYIDNAIAHTPSIVDFYVCKARLLRNAGAVMDAWQVSNEAREMDQADRFLNSEAVQLMLQADQVDKALETISLFTKDGENNNNLHDMQCMWYENEAGYSHLRNEQYGKALKQFLSVCSHFADITEDQFDFHTYCLRKMTLTTYISLLRMEDELHAHKHYCRAAFGVLRAYLGIQDQHLMTPEELKATNEEDKKIRKIKQKEAKERYRVEEEEKKAKEKEDKKEKKEEEKKKSSSGGGVKKDTKTPEEKMKEEEEEIQKLITVEKPLEECSKILELLQLHARDRLETHFLAFEVYLRRGQMLLALRAAGRLHRLSPTHPLTHQAIVKLYFQVSKDPAADTQATKAVRAVLDSEARKLLGKHGDSKDLQAFNRDFQVGFGSSLAHTLVAVELGTLLGGDKKDAVASLLEFTSTDGPKSIKSVDRRVLINVSKLLKQFGNEEASSSWAKRCSMCHPYEPLFKISY